MDNWKPSQFNFIERRRTAYCRRLDPLYVKPLTKFDHKAFD